MRPEGVLKLITLMTKTYPNTYGTYGRQDTEELIETWAMALEEYDDESVMRAFKAFLVSDQKGFPPSVGQIVGRIPRRVTTDEPPRADEPRRVELKRSSEYFPGSIEVGNPHTGEVYYVKYEGYPYGEGDKGIDNEYRDEAIKRWFQDLEGNERKAWKDRGAVFGADFEKWKQGRHRR